MPGELKRLITAWDSSHFAPGRRNVLPGDASTIEALDAAVHHRSWRALIAADKFGADVGSTFHIGLLPMPYLGNLRKGPPNHTKFHHRGMLSGPGGSRGAKTRPLPSSPGFP